MLIAPCPTSSPLRSKERKTTRLDSDRELLRSFERRDGDFRPAVYKHLSPPGETATHRSNFRRHFLAASAFTPAGSRDGDA
jgi:hypothetical protein